MRFPSVERTSQYNLLAMLCQCLLTCGHLRRNRPIVLLVEVPYLLTKGGFQKGVPQRTCSSNSSGPHGQIGNVGNDKACHEEVHEIQYERVDRILEFCCRGPPSVTKLVNFFVNWPKMIVIKGRAAPIDRQAEGLARSRLGSGEQDKSRAGFRWTRPPVSYTLSPISIVPAAIDRVNAIANRTVLSLSAYLNTRW